jgi:hypothetical protein
MLIKPAQKHLITFTFAGISTFNTFNRVLAQTNTEDIIKQSDRAARSLTDRYSAENITQVQQLRDLSPSDWSYEAVRNLTEKYGCMREFPDGTFQSDRSISRYEFAISFTGEDKNMSLHLEAFYQYRLSDNLAITPGIVLITAPNNSDRENDLVIGAIRTTFSF